MNSLPLEVKRSIAFHLRNCDENPHGPRDIKNFRLVNTQLSVIGAEYLLPEIHLTFETKSFQRLQTISQHSFYSEHVKSLYYEPDALGDPDMDVKVLIKDSPEARSIRDRKPPVQPLEGEDDRAYVTELEVFNKEMAAAQIEFDKKCKAFEAVYSDQESIRNQDDPYYHRLMMQVIARLPNLTEVTLNLTNFNTDYEQGVFPPTNAFRRAYAETFLMPIMDRSQTYPFGVRQLSSVLDGAASAGTKLKTLNCGMIHCKLLRANAESFEKMKCAIQHLENFRIAFYTCEGHNRKSKKPLVRRYRMVEWLSAAKDLKTMNFSLYEGHGFNLRFVFGTTTWSSLRVVELSGVVAEEETLIDFLTRHAGTLKDLGLHRIVLESGGWPSALPRIHNAVKLDEFRAVGFWISFSPRRGWEIDTSENSQRLPDSMLSKPCKLGMAVNRYVMNGGMNPLLDTHPGDPIVPVCV